MKMTRLMKSLSFFLCMVLIAAMALTASGCNDNKTTSDPTTSQVSSLSLETEATVLGEGKTEFPFTVVDAEGKETAYIIHTDKKTVGDALIELELIAGEKGDYGLYVKEVAGITLDYNTDGKYWAFYVDGEYATSGVDTTEIKDSSTYSFKAEKA